MGQYCLAANIDKRQFIHPWDFHDGAKLLEFGCSSGGLMTALTILLADGNGRGGGDLHSDHPIIGSWAGDRIVIAGDYADPSKFVEDATPDQLEQAAREHFAEGYQEPERVNLYAFAREHFENVSAAVKQALSEGRIVRFDEAA